MQQLHNPTIGMIGIFAKLGAGIAVVIRLGQVKFPHRKATRTPGYFFTRCRTRNDGDPTLLTCRDHGFIMPSMTA
eukprot:2687407-Pleurochrysis_carterae.AAC.2